MKPFLIISFFLSFCIHCSAGNVIIKGSAKEYAGKTFEFLTFSNSISNKEEILATAKVNANGDFETSFKIDHTEYVICHQGIFSLFLFTEPGNEYVIKMPERIEKKRDDLLNPFFEEIKLHLALTSKSISNNEIASEKEINNQIRLFDSYFDPLYNRFALDVYIKKYASGIDSSLRVLDSLFSHSGNQYFHDYYTYRMGLLKFMSTRFKSRSISDTYFLNKPVLYYNPAYMELFNKIYNKYFVYFGRTKTGKIIYDNINKAQSLSLLKLTLGEDKVLANDTLKELVILKGIHDGCYEMDFSRQALLAILDSLVITTHVEKHRQVGKDIRYKITRLLPGYTPPSFQLFNQDSILTNLDKLKGSLVYLVFGTTQNYICLKEFDFIKKFEIKHPNLLKVVIISADEKLSDMRFFVKKSQSKWTFLHYANQPEVLKAYDIRTIPTAFLIDKEGKLAISPAPLVSENFETILFNYLKNNKLL